MQIANCKLQEVRVPTLCVGTRSLRRSASNRATQSVADRAFPRRAWERGLCFNVHAKKGKKPTGCIPWACVPAAGRPASAGCAAELGCVLAAVSMFKKTLELPAADGMLK